MAILQKKSQLTSSFLESLSFFFLSAFSPLLMVPVLLSPPFFPPVPGVAFEGPPPRDPPAPLPLSFWRGPLVGRTWGEDLLEHLRKGLRI